MHQGREASTETSGHLVLQGLDDPGLKILLFLPHVTIFSIRVEFVQVVGIPRSDRPYTEFYDAVLNMTH